MGVALEKQQIISFDGRITVDNSNEMREKLGAALKLKPKAINGRFVTSNFYGHVGCGDVG